MRQIRHSSLMTTKKYFPILTDDVLTTTGNGTLLCGKEELEAYILAGGKSRMYWIRDTKEITVNANRGLAWETGFWNALQSGRR